MNDHDTRGQDEINGPLNDTSSDEYPNVLTLLTEEQWVGSDQDIHESIKLLANVLTVRADRRDQKETS